MTMQHLDGFAALADAYDGFIIDLWGVIHDGVTPYEGAVDCLRRLRGLGKPYVLLSNAPRRAEVARAGMRMMGIDDTLTGALLTSGEQTWRMLRERDDPFFAALGTRVLHLGPERDRSVMDGLELMRVDDPASATFVLNTGPDDHAGPAAPEQYDALLAACRAADLPMVCANPDLEVIRGGLRVICAGTLTQRYEAMGGRARWIGKPDPAIYAPTIDCLGVKRERVLAIGDALRTDIAGAQAADIPSCWILGGIHSDWLRTDAKSTITAAKDLAAEHGLARSQPCRRSAGRSNDKSRGVCPGFRRTDGDASRCLLRGAAFGIRAAR